MNDAGTTSSALGSFAGWIIFGVNFLLPLLSREIRRDQRLALVFWCSLLLRQTLALGTGFLHGPSSDANWFHDWGIARSREAGLSGLMLTVGGQFYERLLGAVYDVLGASPFLAAELSVLAFSLSMIAFVNVVRELGITRYRAGLLVLYSIPFSALYFTSTILREAYQLLGFVLAVQFALRYKRTGSPLAILLACASALFMALFHDGLILFSALFVVVVILWPAAAGGTERGVASRREQSARRVAAGLVVLAILVTGVQLISRGLGSATLAAVVSKRAVEYAVKYREGGLRVEARTNYDVRLDISSPPAFVASVVRVFVYYMFSPFPWQIRSPVDVLGSSEAILRFLLLALALREWRRATRVERRTRSFLLVLYLALAGLWSLGTVNYGTAFRHHVTTNWILLLLGGPVLLHASARALRGLLGTGPRLAAGSRA